MIPDSQEHRVVIVGASLAGSATAITLAQQQIPVLVLDRHAFPRRKSCGEGLSHLGPQYLSRLGINPSQCTGPENEFFGYSFLTPSNVPEKSKCFRAHTPVARGWGIMRSTLDSLLIEKAREFPHIEIHLGEDVIAVTRNGDTWRITTSTRTLTCRFLVLAAGAQSSLLCPKHIEAVHPPSSRIGFTLHAYVSGGELPKLVMLIPLPGGEIYVTRLNQDTANISLVGTNTFIQEYRSTSKLNALLYTTLGLQFVVSERGLGASNFESRHRSRSPYLYLVGDSIESFDPACGLGMTHALSSGIVAAHSIARVFRDKTDATQALSAYEAAHEISAQGVRRYSASIRRLLWLYQKSPALFRPFNGPLAGAGVRLLEKVTRPLQEAHA